MNITQASSGHSAGPVGTFEAAEAAGGVAAVMGVTVRVAGRTPTRVDMRCAGTPQRQLSLTLGAVLVVVGAQLTVEKIAQFWAQAAPLAGSLRPFVAGRRGAVATGPWSATAMVRFAGVPEMETLLLPARRGSELPTMLRIRVGPVSWEVCDAASYTTVLRAWRTGANLLGIDSEQP